MKPFFVLFIAFCLFSACTQTPQTMDVAQAQTDIMRLIEQERRAFYNKDLAAWSQCFVQNDKLSWVYVAPDLTLRARGWQDLSAFMRDWMTQYPEKYDYNKADFKRSDIRLTLNNHLAMISFVCQNIQPDGSPHNTIETNTLFKDQQGWKILSTTSYPADTPEGSSTNAYVYPK